jgi:heme-degrading monooxygenase HmoA
MYVARHHLEVAPDQQSGLLAEMKPVHAELRSRPGFRWAMVLRSADDQSRLAAVAMWLNRQAAGNADFPVQHYEVATARGSMTPASVAAIVDWRVQPDSAPGFVNRWNAAYHAIEDTIGSRLLQDLDDPAHYAGLHVATSDANITDAILERANAEAGAGTLPDKVERFVVLDLAEA